MQNNELQGSIRALLHEYKKAINELITIIKPLKKVNLTKIVDNMTNDPDCKSIQTILSHLVCSGYDYTIYIENSLGSNKPLYEKATYNSINQNIEQLNLMFNYCENFFKSNPNLTVEQKDPLKKINVKWGQQYDVEQLLEHAIVHILRHRRQIENFIVLQNEKTH